MGSLTGGVGRKMVVVDGLAKREITCHLRECWRRECVQRTRAVCAMTECRTVEAFAPFARVAWGLHELADNVTALDRDCNDHPNDHGDHRGQHLVHGHTARP